MMEYFRKYLIFIRKKNNTLKIKPNLANTLLIGSIIGVAAGVLLDVFLPFQFFLNMVRGIIANVVGVALFSYLYLLITKTRNERIKKDKYYKPIRKRFSYRQRVNISIVIGAAIALFILLSGKTTPIYTLKSIIAITAALLLVAFSRRDRDEFIKSIYDIPDVRDLEFMSKKKEEKKSSVKKSKKKAKENEEKEKEE